MFFVLELRRIEKPDVSIVKPLFPNGNNFGNNLNCIFEKFQEHLLRKVHH
jgi:hypothetical protein